METKNGTQAQFGFTGQPTTAVNGANPAMPIRHNSVAMPLALPNNNSAVMPVAQRNVHADRDPRGLPGQHQIANNNGYAAPLRGSPGESMPSTQGQAQIAQRAPQAAQPQAFFTGHEPVNGYEWNPALSAVNNPAAMNALHQFFTALECPQQSQTAQPYQTPQQHQSPRQYQTLLHQAEQYQVAQQYQAAQEYQRRQQLQHPLQYSTRHCQTSQQDQNRANGTAGYPNSSNDNAPVVDAVHLSANSTSHLINQPAPSPNHQGDGQQSSSGSPSVAGNTPSAGVAEPAQPLACTETPEGFQKEVNHLVHDGAGDFIGLIRNKADYDRYQQAVWKAKLSGGSFEKRAQDYPKDEAGQMKIRKRIFDAFYNLGGDQDPACEAGDFADCLAVKTVQGLSVPEGELLSYDLTEDLLKVQSGEPLLPPNSKVLQEATFGDKVNVLVSALSFNKLLCRSMVGSDNFRARVAADPAGERKRKVENIKTNIAKAKILAADAQKRGKTRGRKGKRAASETEANSQSEAGAEVSEAVDACVRNARPVKRSRTIEPSSQAPQVQIQGQATRLQPAQPMVTGPIHGYTHTSTINATQAAINTSQGTPNQPREAQDLNYVFIEQAQAPQAPQATSSANDDMSHGLIGQNH